MHDRQKHLYVGVDLHKHHHVAVIINCWQEKLGEIKFENKPSAFSTFLLYIDKRMEEGLTSVFGLEDVGGYDRALAKYLTDHGQVVKEVNPALSYAERKSHMTTQKSDSWDAECVARILLNKLNHLPGLVGKVRNKKANREIGRCTLYFTTWQCNKCKWQKEANCHGTQCSKLTTNGN